MSMVCFLTSLPLSLRLPSLRATSTTPPPHHLHTPKATTTTTPSPPPPPPPVSPPKTTSTPLYTCPNCRAPIHPSTQRSCPSCNNRFPRTSNYLDLTIQEPSTRNPLDFIRRTILDVPIRQELFRSPSVSWLYERGWRNGFYRAGFPGADKEFELVCEYFGHDVDDEDVVLDLSCGSGLMTRRLVGRFKKVIAVDYSESMLEETAKRMRENRLSFQIVRGAAEYLPFCDQGVGFVHTGAALHCWNRVQDGLKEVVRVLKPGGKFFATTFIVGAYGTPRAMRRSGFRYFEREELVYLLNGAGFDMVDVEVVKNCAIIRCEKAKK